MKKQLPLLIAGLAVLWFVSAFRAPRQEGLATAEFGRLPVLLQGRVQPLDSVARNALLQLRTKQSVRVTDPATGKALLTLSAIEWLQEVLFKPELADTRPTFRIDHPEVISLLKVRREDKHFSFAELQPGMEELEREARRINDSGLKPEQQNPFQKAVMVTYDRLILYQRLKNTVKPERVQDFGAELASYTKNLEPGRAAAVAEREGKPHDKAALDALVGHMTQFEMMSRFAYALVVPGVSAGHAHDDWSNVGAALMQSARDGAVPEPVAFYAAMNDSFRGNDAARFNQAVSAYQGWLNSHGYAQEVSKGRSEDLFNRVQFFYRAMTLYVLAFILAAVSWFNRNELFRRTGAILILVALVIHTAGLIYRMALEGRPPVTNLYSSAIFIGWGAAIFGIGLERIQRDGIGTVIAGIAGFSTLVIAHNLAMSGDTMKMLVAVLDTNFWLATHVVVITLGYSATFVAGFLAVLYVARGFFTSTLSTDMARGLSRMVYGVTCFATLFSFVGTVLGGIWADQSWGRFWGWDPKENGALLIVLWNAFYLHARWGRLFSEKGLMAVAIVGNIITAFSWFGVNMLGIGLHSYGFMDSAFRWLILFDATQVLLTVIALLPLRFWRSARHLAPSHPPGGPGSTPGKVPTLGGARAKTA